MPVSVTSARVACACAVTLPSDPGCEDCHYWNESIAAIEPAEWHWQVRIDTYHWAGGSGSTEGFEWFHFMTTKVDPRDVDYDM